MSRWLVLPILFFLASSFALLYISSHFPLFSAYACSPFSFRYAFYCCCSFALPGSWNSPWMPWLTPCPNCFPTASNFFFFFPMKGALTQGGRFQLLVCLYCSHETLAKLFLSGLLPVDGLCGLHGFLGLLQHQMPCGILMWGRSAGWGRK